MNKQALKILNILKEQYPLEDLHLKNALTNKDFCLAFNNFMYLCNNSLESAMVCSRFKHEESPTLYLSRFLKDFDEYFNKITLIDNTNNDLLQIPIYFYISFLMNKNFDDSFKNAITKKDEYETQIDFLLAQWLWGFEKSNELEALLLKLSKNKKSKLLYETNELYLQLLKTKNHNLVSQAEENYLKRKKDIYYSNILSIEGGGPDNDYMIDFRLAAILKYIGYTGETIHNKF